MPNALERLLERGINALVCGANRTTRQQTVRRSALGTDFEGHMVELRLQHDAADRLEEVAAGHTLVAVLDAHRISPRDLWAVRSVVQQQPHVTYIFEGAHRTKMLDMVVRYDAAFYRQLAVIDLS